MGQVTHIGFVGLGKLGLDCAEVFARHYTVLGYDSQPRTSDTVKICDLDQVVNGADWIFVAVPTPHEQGYGGDKPTSHLEPRDFDYAAVKQVLQEINHRARTPKRIVLISTVLPGTCRHQLAHLLGRQHELLYNPYLIAMGSVKWDMVNPEMIIVGTDQGQCTESAQTLLEIYQPLMQNTPRCELGTWEEGEAIKIFYNTFISAKIGLVNMIQDFAMKIGNIDVDRVTGALSASTQRITGSRYMTAGLGDAGACHPRDNIALRWLAKEYELGYDLFDTIMQAREHQARNLAEFLVVQAQRYNLPIVIHGKAYKPDVPYCDGSYSVLTAHYVQQLGHRVSYIDPMASDCDAVVDTLDRASVILWAHNRTVTYGHDSHDQLQAYCEIPSGSVIVDPWRQLSLDISGVKVVHYGNTRSTHALGLNDIS